MKRTLLIFALLLFSFGAAWQRPTQPPEAYNLRSIVLRSHEKDTSLWVASPQSIYEQNNSGIWQKKWTLASGETNIQSLKTFEAYPYLIFALTNDGLFAGHLLTDSWEQIFYGQGSNENDILSFEIHPVRSNLWLLGTRGGLFTSLDSGRTWKQNTFLANESISFVHATSQQIIIGTTQQVLRTHDLKSFLPLHLFSVDHFNPNDDLEQINPDSDLKQVILPDSLKNHVTSDHYNWIWISTPQGIYQSSDAGFFWERLPATGLPSYNITQIRYDVDFDYLFASTAKGFFRYDFSDERWVEIYQGLDSADFKDFTIEQGDLSSVAAITSHGFFRYPLSMEVAFEPKQMHSIDTLNFDTFHRVIEREPSIQEIQKLVIRYNDVSDSKINRWHLASRVRALLPDFSLRQDFSRANNIDLDRGSTSEPDQYIFGPDNINRGWDFSVSWDLGDLIWSSSQTSIDSRSKSTVDLRHDLLGEATRIFYERRRLQLEVFTTQEYSLEKMIRIEELTALLDGMCGGCMSQAPRSSRSRRS